jgi:hypothetical protein
VLNIKLFFFFAFLGLELRAYTLSHSTSPAFLCDGIFRDRVTQTILPRLALNLDPPDLCLLSSWDYRYESIGVQPNIKLFGLKQKIDSCASTFT